MTADIKSVPISPHGQFSEANVLVGGVVVAAILAFFFLPAAPRSADDIAHEARMKRVREIAVVSAFPIDDRMSDLSCSRYGSNRDACMRSERALRAEASALWLNADLLLRLRCFNDSEEAPGPTGFIYACMSAARNPERPLP